MPGLTPFATERRLSTAAVDLYGLLSNMERFQRHQAARPELFNELFGPTSACVKDGAVITIAGSLATSHDNHDHRPAAPRVSR